MLAGRPAYTDAALHNAVDLAVSLMDTALLVIALYKTKRSLICKRTDGPCTEGLAFSEDNLGIIMRLTLVLTREV